MAEQEKKRRPAAATRDEQATEETEASAPSPQGEKLKAELDDLLDEIDEVLEENAEEFVRNYVQKGGE
ncbi:MAG TPA: ubiquitin-like protein Pup [Acidimicrobiales bacterium]|nr:ubiquitin-like protein Pup [Acidimicrobiales bacterium]